MARTEITYAVASKDGTVIGDPMAADVVNGMYVDNDGSTMLLVENTHVDTAQDITFHITRTVDGQAVTPRVETVAVGETRLFGGFSVKDYGQVLQVDAADASLTALGLRAG